MAFSFFGKKDKNTPEAAAPVAKAPPAPPKIQTPPGVASIPTVKPPQPSGLIPTSGMPAGAATTQPMVMPRTAGSGLKPTRPGVVQSTRSTQRIVLPGSAPGKPTGTKSLSMAAAPPASGRINLPMGMILRCLPTEVLAGDLAEFEASGAAATEIGLPMNMILSQLPSGKVEMSLADLVPHFPPGFLQPTASIASYLPTLVNLPLMDVVMRIPPDLLALRPDQKGVDASVINMADPFTEEILREQAEAARRQQAVTAQAAQANIIEESQVSPTEEFVPNPPSNTAKTIAPPPRPSMATMSPSVTAPQGGHVPPTPMPSARLPGSVVPTSPSLSARTISPSGQLMTPTRATAAIPARPQASITSQLQAQTPLPPQSTTPIPTVPPVPRPMAAMPPAPVPPVPRQTTSLPMPLPPVQPSVPPPAAFAPPTPPPVVAAPQPPLVQAPVEVAPVEVPAPGVPDSGADDLQRLAALAMAQMSEEDEPAGETADLSGSDQTVPVHTPAIPVGETYPETVPIPGNHPAPVAFTPPPAPGTVPLPVAQPAPAPFAFTPPVEATVPIPAVNIAPPAPVARPVPVAVPAPVAFTPPAPVPVVAPAPEPVPAPVAFTPPPPAPVVARPPEPVPAPVAFTPPPPAPVAAPAPVITPAVQAPTSIVNPEAVVAPPAPVPAKPEAAPATTESGDFNLNTCTVEDLLHIPGCFRELAESIIRHRAVIGSYQKVEDLLDVPGITKAAYTSLTGENPPPNRIPLTLNELLGFPAEQHATLKEVTDRICCWPDITGCVLSQGSGLSLTGTTPAGLDKAALVAFVPKMFDELNKSFSEIAGKQTNDLVIPTAGTSFHILRDNDLYLIILSRLPQMPERHLKVARFVLSALSIRRD